MIGQPLTRAVRSTNGQRPFARVKGWLWITAYTLFIYGTLPFARDWQVFLKNALGQHFSLVINLTMVGVALLTGAWLIRRMAGFRIWFFLGLVLLTIWFVSQIELPEERIHIMEYAVLGYLVAGVAARSLTGILFFAMVLLAGFLIGFGDEVIQGILPNRVFDWRDVIMNGTGVILGLVVMRLSR